MLQGLPAGGDDGHDDGINSTNDDYDDYDDNDDSPPCTCTLIPLRVIQEAPDVNLLMDWKHSSIQFPSTALCRGPPVRRWCPRCNVTAL